MQRKLKTVPYVNYQKYLGKWYEIAHKPFEWQPPGTTNTTAEYSLLQKEPLRIQVKNTTRFQGSEIESIGVATRNTADPTTNAKLRVQFRTGGPPGDYWIIDLDEKDYQWAVVGTPNRRNFWILSRSPTLDTNTLNQILKRADRLHQFDLSDLILTEQYDVTR